ncbi:MAG: GTPase [Candidatus Schekmanbacteria bacterium GWA2_38_11]|uniref:GTPase n=1 Tax=Candidatus Schekmanbacteria bacterium GWA2_38_11 TaxID=1817876 RepID=A0A1F7RCB2_9BACT|nr:MAG: GTPase [Candidatus Schekmanbacteria bacterium GWA2_38_11]
MNLVEEALKGNYRAIARIITMIENDSPEGIAMMKELHLHTGKAYVIGITGAPGVGKSTLVDKIIEYLRNEKKKVGVVAVDPSSPFSGGAILADRIRMQHHFLDEGVFIRSMATRGSFGGLSRTTKDAVKVLDASGFDFIIIETVGVGQDEVDVVKFSKTTLVAFAPGLGDEVQAMKAGIMEIGDIFVINKADREDADKTEMDINAMLGLNPKKNGWVPIVVKTVATTGEGIKELMKQIDLHRDFLEKNTSFLYEKEIYKSEMEIATILKEKLFERALEKTKAEGGIRGYAEKVASREIDAYTAAEKILDTFKCCSN